MAQEAKNVFDGLKAAQEEFARKTAPPPDTRKDDWRKNPLYEDIVPVLDAALNAAREAAEVAKSTKSQLDKTSALYAIERMRNEYDKADMKPSDKRFEDLVAEAVAAKELDAQGMPTLSKVLNRYSEPKRMEAYAAQKIEEAKKEWEKKQRIGEVPKPGKFHNVKADEAPIENLDELTSELVANDPDIQAAMNDDRTH